MLVFFLLFHLRTIFYMHIILTLNFVAQYNSNSKLEADTSTIFGAFITQSIDVSVRNMSNEAIFIEVNWNYYCNLIII